MYVMKTLLTLSFALWLPLLAFGQDDSFMRLYEKYSGRDGFTTVEMSGMMLRAFNAAGSDVSGIPALDNVDRLVIIISEGEDERFAEDVGRMLREGGYTSASIVRDGTQSVEFFIKEQDGLTAELILNVRDGHDAQVVMLLAGHDLSITQISGIAGAGIALP